MSINSIICCFITTNYAFFETYYTKYMTVFTYWSTNCFTDCIVHQMLSVSSTDISHHQVKGQVIGAEEENIKSMGLEMFHELGKAFVSDFMFASTQFPGE